MSVRSIALARITELARKELLRANLADPNSNEGIQSGIRLSNDPDLIRQFHPRGIHPGILKVALSKLETKSRWLEVAILGITTGVFPSPHWTKEKVRNELGISNALADEIALLRAPDEVKVLIPVNLDENVTRTAVSLVYAESLPYRFSESLSEEMDLEGVNFMNGCYAYGLLWTVARQLLVALESTRLYGGNLRGSFEDFSYIKSMRNLAHHVERLESVMLLASEQLIAAYSRWHPAEEGVAEAFTIQDTEKEPTKLLVETLKVPPVMPRLVVPVSLAA